MNTKVAALKAHITDTVANFEAVGKQFSAHDVTLALREGVNNKNIEFDDRPFETIPGPHGTTIHTQKVQHSEVRDTVHSMYDDGDFPNLDQDGTGNFILYRVKSGGVPVPPTSSGIGGANMMASPAYPTAANPSGVPANFGQATAASVTSISTPPINSYPQLDNLLNTRRNRKGSQPIHRLKYKGQFLTTGTGRTAFKRRCDLTQAFHFAQKDIKAALANGDAEIVTL